jgi:hypothetical protein
MDQSSGFYSAQYQKESIGYSVWICGITGDRKDNIAHCRDRRQAERVCRKWNSKNNRFGIEFKGKGK